MFNSYLKFLDKEEIPLEKSNISPKYKNLSTISELTNSPRMLESKNQENHSAYQNSSPREIPRTISEKAGYRLYNHGMLQKEKRKREQKEAEIKRKIDEVKEIKKKHKILPLSREIVKELNRGDTITENEKWLAERELKMHVKRQEKIESEISENKKCFQEKSQVVQRSKIVNEKADKNQSELHSLISYLQ